MKPHQERVVTEKSDLDEKISKLNAFIGTGTFKDLDSHEKASLDRQLRAMRNYSRALAERIERFT